MIYTASKTVHAAKWKALRADGWPIISTWIDEAGVGETPDYADLWSRCVAEAAKASVLLLYREPGEVLKGAFIEAGIALSFGKPVYAIGCEEFSFVNHPLVRQFEDLPSVLAALHRLYCWRCQMSALNIARETLLAALPEGVPPSFTSIDGARFNGACEVIADLTMFDGLKAVAHFRKWSLGWSTGWDDMPGGDTSFEDGAWGRVVRK